MTNEDLFYILYKYCRSGEMVDTSDSKSDERMLLRVQVPPSVPIEYNNYKYITAFSNNKSSFLLYDFITGNKKYN